MAEPKTARCRMCGETFVYNGDLPPCVVRFFGKESYADLCYACGVRLAEFIKSYRQKRHWRDMIV